MDWLTVFSLLEFTATCTSSYGNVQSTSTNTNATASSPTTGTTNSDVRIETTVRRCSSLPPPLSLPLSTLLFLISYRIYPVSLLVVVEEAVILL